MFGLHNDNKGTKTRAADGWTIRFPGTLHGQGFHAAWQQPGRSRPITQLGWIRHSPVELAPQDRTSRSASSSTNGDPICWFKYSGFCL